MKTIACLLALGSVVQAQDANPAALGNAVNWSTEPEWTVRAGVEIHQFTFKTGVAGKSEWKGFFNRTYGRGDVGLASKRRGVTYDDGAVYQSDGNGNTYAKITSPSQFSDTGRFYGNFPFNYPIYQPSFHTYSRSETLRSFAGFQAGQEDTIASPAIEIARHVASYDGLEIGVSFGLSSSSMNETAPPAVSALATTFARNRAFTYAYDYLGYTLPKDAGPTSVGSIYTGPGDWSGIVFAPRKSSAVTRSLVTYALVTSGHVDLTMQTLTFDADFSWKPSKHLRLGLSAGPTVNIASSSTHLSTDVYRNGNPVPFAQFNANRDKTQTVLGARVLGNAQYDLTDDGRWFVEAHAGYEWMQPLKLGMGLQDASVDGSSWMAGISLGYRLGLNNAVNWADEPKWTVKAGVDAHNFSLKTGLGGRSDWAPFFNRSSGRGNVGTLGSANSIQYDDGMVDSNGVGYVNSVHKINQNPERFAYLGWQQNVVWEAEFHTYSRNEHLRSFTGFTTSRDQGVASPSFEFERKLVKTADLDLGLSVGWAGSFTQMNTPEHVAALATTLATRKNYTYTYTFDPTNQTFSAQGPTVIKGVFTSSNPSGNFLPPNITTATSRGLLNYALVSSSHVDLTMQTMSFAADFSWKPLQRLSVGISVGPTVNIASSTTDLTTEIINTMDGRTLAQVHGHEDKTQVCLGWRTLATARYDLTRDGHWFVDAHAGYEWMEAIRLDMGRQHAEVDPSSWHLGLSLGHRFGVRTKVAGIQAASRSVL